MSQLSPKPLTPEQLFEAKDRLGDNWMGPADAPLTDWVLGALFEDGVTPETMNGSEAEKKQYSDYYASRMPR
jgi:hypothetical protein